MTLEMIADLVVATLRTIVSVATLEIPYTSLISSSLRSSLALTYVVVHVAVVVVVIEILDVAVKIR